jgi:penicillin amidase
MRASKIIISFLVLTVAVSGGIQAQDDPVTTTRDAQGIWFIEGGSLYDVYEAMGYAMAQDRLVQMDIYRRTARGTMSELFGAEFAGTNYLAQDMFMRNLMHSDDECAEEFAALSEDAQTAIQAYVDGINRFVYSNFDNFYLMPYEYWMGSFFFVFMNDLTYNTLPAPFTVNDVLVWGATLQRQFEGEALDQGQLENAKLFETWAAVFPDEYLYMFTDQRWINDPSAQTMIPHGGGASAKAYREPVLPSITAESFPDMGKAVESIRSHIDQYQGALEAIGVIDRMGSYAWAVSGDKTASGNPIVYSGPEMGFSMPSIVAEGSIRGGGLEVSGMTVPLIPGIIIGRTPHHAWSSQVGHAHTQDWFIDSPLAVSLHRMETFHPAGGDPVTVPYFRTHHGPILSPFPYDPTDPPPFVVSWAYANWDHEAKMAEALLDNARAESIAEFGVGVAKIASSQHITYVDRDGNIAYWMSGWDPIRAPGVDPRCPQNGDGTQEWTGERRALAHDANTAQGFYGGWNNKASIDYNSPPNNLWYNNGTAHRAHAVTDYLSTHDDLTFEQVRDLALNIATTTGLMGGGNSWSFVEDAFKDAVAANPSPERDAAIELLDAWDGHFVAGGPDAWRFGIQRADAWVLQDWWIREALRITFEDEFSAAGLDWEDQPVSLSFNVLLHALAGQTYYDWFQDKRDSGKVTGAEAIIVQALDNVLGTVGLWPYNIPRGTIDYSHMLLSELPPPLGPAFTDMWSTPFSQRSTYAHVVEFGESGPVRIESMFPLGESGHMDFNGTMLPTMDPNFFSMVPAYDPFMPRPFPLFTEDED